MKLAFASAVSNQFMIVKNDGVDPVTSLPNGQIQVAGTGVIGLGYAVEANSDLSTTDWLQLGVTLGRPPAGALEFTDVNAAQYPQRFYRFVLQ